MESIFNVGRESKFYVLMGTKSNVAMETSILQQQHTELLVSNVSAKHN
jgi:hypothetical protein